MIWIIVVGGILLIWIGSLIVEFFRDKERAENQLQALETEVRNFLSQVKGIDHSLETLNQARANLDRSRDKIKKELAKDKDALEQEKQDLDEIVKQRGKGFPLLAELYKDYFNMKAKIETDKLKYKQRPALKAAEAIKKSNREKRQLVTMLKMLELKIKNYEDIAPFLKEEVEENLPSVEELQNFAEYTEEEKEDEVTRFLTKEEYRKLTTPEKNQLALDRYFQKRKKSPWAIGKMYEHYVGYIYEAQGWDVEYFGIKKRREDMGRDIIAIKGDQCHIVQCKHWSRFKTVFENEIFQLFGTAYEYKKKNEKLKVTPIFFTSTKLSDKANDIAKLLGITVKQEVKLKEYPAIKCNISRIDRTKIYHLPFDQQYDTTRIEKKRGEFYCLTVAEAEDKGFRRAFKWQGEKNEAASR